jgi:hypothetical protein
MARRKKPTDDESTNENLGNTNQTDDTFGLPEIEYKPLDRDESSSTASEAQQESIPEQSTSIPQYQYEERPVEGKSEYTYVPEEEAAPVWPKVLGILLVIALALGAAWYLIYYKPAQADKEKLAKAKLEQEQKAKADQDRLAEEQRLRDEAERLRADSIANVSKVGVVETLSERTGRYYVVVASAVDDDLLMDYANKLSGTGVSSKIIPPFAKYKFYRLTIAEGDTFASAQEVANSKKSEYGDALWVLKY